MAGKEIKVADCGGMGGGSIESGTGYDYEMGGAPKKKARESCTHISSVVGKNVTVVRKGRRLPVSIELGGKQFDLEDGDRVETGGGSYAIGIMDVPNSDPPSNVPTTSISIYPESAIEISTRHSASKTIVGGFDYITRVEFIRGMLLFGGPCEFSFKSGIPIKLSPMPSGNAMSFCAEIRQDGSVAFFNRVAEIEHLRAKVRAGLFAKETIATNDALYDMPSIEPRYAEAFKAIGLWAKSQGVAVGRSMQGRAAPGVDDFKKEMQGSIAANVAQMKKELAENEDLPRSVAADYKKQIADFESGKGVSKTFAVKDEADERKKEAARKAWVQKFIAEGDAALSQLANMSLPSPQKLDSKYMVSLDKSERRTMGMDEYVRHVWSKGGDMAKLTQQFNAGKISKAEYAAKMKSLDEEAVAPMKKQMEHMANMGKGGKPMLDAVGAKAKVGKTIQYGAISVEVREAERGPEFRMVKCPSGSQFVAISVKVENTASAATAYIVPDEEMWLGFGAGEPAKSENYKFETALDKGKPSEGYVWFIVPSDAKKFSLLLGKRKMPKLSVDFSL